MRVMFEDDEDVHRIVLACFLGALRMDKSRSALSAERLKGDVGGDEATAAALIGL